MAIDIIKQDVFVLNMIFSFTLGDIKKYFIVANKHMNNFME